MMLSKSTAAVLDVLTANLPTDRSRHIGEKGGAYMQVVVEKVGPAQFSVAHYFVQEGDLCQDPEMVFARTSEGAWVAVYFQQAMPPRFDVAHEVDAKGYPTKINPAAARDLTSFAATWMRNIVHQQGGDSGTLAGLRRVVAECQRAESRPRVEETEETAAPEPETAEQAAERAAVEAFNAYEPPAGSNGGDGFRRPVQMSLF